MTYELRQTSVDTNSDYNSDYNTDGYYVRDHKGCVEIETAPDVQHSALLLPSERNQHQGDSEYIEYTEEEPELDFSPSESELLYMTLKDKMTDIGGAYDDLKPLLRFYWKSLRTLEPYQLRIIEGLHERFLAQTSALGSIKLAEEGDVLSAVSLLNEVKVSKGSKVYEYHCIYVGVTPEDTPRVFVKVHSTTKDALPESLVIKLALDEELYAGRVLRFAI